MSTIMTVLNKEFKDTLRDRRTLITAVLLPSIIFPLLFMGMTEMETNRMEEEATKKLDIALVNTTDDFTEVMSADTSLVLKSNYTAKTAKTAIQADELDAALIWSKDENENAGKLRFFYKASHTATYARVMQQVSVIENKMVQSRVAKLDINPEVLTPFAVAQEDVTTENEEMAALIGSVLPLIFIIFCFVGCMYPAIDLITGEKEKGTIETLLTVPASRFEILIGKMLTIAIMGLMSATMTICGIYLSVSLFSDATSEMAGSIGEILNWKSILLLCGMLIPLSIFFAGLLSAIVVRAKTFKESQSRVTPITFLVSAPAIIAMGPEVNLNWENVWIPVYNMAVSIEQIMDGTIQIQHYLVIVLTLCLVAFAAIYYSVKQFSKESMILS